MAQQFMISCKLSSKIANPKYEALERLREELRHD